MSNDRKSNFVHLSQLEYIRPVTNKPSLVKSFEHSVRESERRYDRYLKVVQSLAIAMRNKGQISHIRLDNAL
jgi:hypothetical protein